MRLLPGFDRAAFVEFLARTDEITDAVHVTGRADYALRAIWCRHPRLRSGHPGGHKVVV